MKNLQIKSRFLEGPDIFRIVYENSPIGMVLVDRNHNLIDANKAYCKILGYSPEELKSKTLYDITHPDDIQRNLSLQQKLGIGEIPFYQIQKRYLRKDGTVAWGLLVASLIRGHHGNPNYFIGQFIDISEIKKSEEAIRKSEEEFKFLAENMGDIIWTLDRGFNTTYVSPSIKKILGFTPEERKSQLLAEKVTPNSFEMLKKRFLEELEKDKEDSADLERAVNLEVEYYHKNGSIVWLENNVKAIRNSSGKIIGIHGVSRDISLRKKAEQAQRVSQERLESLLHLLPVGIVIVDQETHKIVDANPKAVLMTDMPLETLVGAKCHNFICPAEKGKCPITDLGKSIDNSERILLNADQEKIPVFKTVIPVEMDDRKLLIECFVDISEQKNAENERIEKEKLKGVIETAGAVCHEMNQPMQAIVGYSELLMMDMKDYNPSYNNIKKIGEQVERLGNITKKLANITKYETMEYLTRKIIDIDKSST